MNFYNKKRRTPTIAIVSLIDILAILLIFFIITTTFKKTEPKVVINLPKSSTAVAAAESTDPVVVRIDPEQRVWLDEEPCSIEDLGATVAQILQVSPKRPFALKADESTPFSLLISVLDALKENGVEQLPAFTRPAQ